MQGTGYWGPVTRKSTESKYTKVIGLCCAYSHITLVLPYWLEYGRDDQLAAWQVSMYTLTVSLTRVNAVTQPDWNPRVPFLAMVVGNGSRDPMTLLYSLFLYIVF